MYSKNNPFVFILLIWIGLIILIFMFSKVYDSNHGIYDEKGTCPVCHEELEKYSYGQYGINFAWSCPNGCED